MSVLSSSILRGCWLVWASAQVHEQRVNRDPGGSLTAGAGLRGGRWSRRKVVVALTTLEPGAGSLRPDLALTFAGEFRLKRHPPHKVRRNAHMRWLYR